MKNSNKDKEKIKSIDLKKRIIFSFILTIIFPAVFLLLVEISLRIVNYGDDYSLFKDFDLYGKKYRACNREFGKKYFYNLPFTTPNNDIFLKEKPKNGFRIFVIGSSTAVGFPYSSGIMFSRILQARLQDSYPVKQFEVVNTAMTAINSYTFQDKIDEILKEKPDAILIYGGQNEFYGGFGISSKDAFGTIRWIKLLHLNLLEFKTYQLIRNIIFGTQRLFTDKKISVIPENETLMQAIAANRDVEYNSKIYKLAHEHYKKNMSTVLRKARNKGVPVFFSELISNIRDLPPFGSSKSNNYPPANEVYKQALAFEKEGDFEKAKTYFYRAKDLDCIRFRASEDLNKIIDELSKEFGTYLIPMKSLFEEHSLNGLIGNNLITEHVHPNIDGYFLMADAFYSSLVNSKVIGKIDSLNYKPSEYYRRHWGFTQLDSMSSELLVHKIKSGWPFMPETVKNNFIKDYKPKGIIDSLALQSIRYEGFNLEVAHKFLAKYYILHNEPEKAFLEYNSIMKIQPYNLENYIDAGNLLFQSGKYDEALVIFLQALKINRDIYLLNKIGEIYSNKKDFGKAIPYYEEVIKMDPNFRKQAILGLLLQAYKETGNQAKANEIFNNNRQLFSQNASNAEKKEVVLRIPPDVRKIIEQAIKCLQSGNIDQALSLLNKANTIHETTLENRFLGDIWLKRRDRKALYYLKKVYSDYSTDPDYLNTLCYASIYFKEYTYAKKILPELKQLSPNNPNIPAFEKKISQENK